VAVIIAAFAATPASGYLVGPAVGLEELAGTADLVCKVTVVADHPAADAWFEALGGFEVRETEMRVVSIIKGPSGARVVRFRHYAPAAAPAFVSSYEPQSYSFTIGRPYIVFAAKAEGDTYRQLSKRHTSKADQGVLLAADDAPHRGKTITEAAWAELRGLLASTTAHDAVQAIVQLDEMSGGHSSELKDFDRHTVLVAIEPMILAKTDAVAKAAITVFGADSPYFDDRQAGFWLAGMGKGTIPGLGARTPGNNPAADLAVKELLVVASGQASAELRGLAIRALGRSHAVPAAKLAEWSRDPEPMVRRAAVLVSAELADHKLIANGSGDAAADVRRAAALSIGFAQDPALVPILDTLLKDAAPEVRVDAALSLLSFAPDQAGAVMKANLGSDFRSLFVNALARRTPVPYLPMLAEVIEKQLQPSAWWGGTIPAGDSWAILFGYVKSRPPPELTAGMLDPSLDALERMRWFSSSEPRDLYALYLRRGLLARAKRFRDATRKAVTYDIDYYFDMADKNPATYAP
jgi:HEAT repeat protein